MLHQNFEDTAKQVQQGAIDPNQWWNGTADNPRSTGSKILTAIGMLFGGAGIGVSGHPELASQAIDTAVNREIDSQKANLQNKQNLLSKYLEMYNNLPMAENAARLTMNAGIEGMINQHAAQLGSANAINTATMANAQRRTDLLPHLTGLAQGQVMQQMYQNMMPTSGAQGAQGPQGPTSGAQGDQGPQNSGGIGGMSPDEAQFKHQLQNMRILNPEVGKELESKYLPGVGIASRQVPETLVEQLAARKDLSDKLAQLENFADQNSGTIFNRAIVNQGTALAQSAQDAYRQANKQGVFREAEKEFVNSMLNKDPTAFFTGYRHVPGYIQLRKSNNDTLKQYYKAYGIQPFGAGSGYGSQGPTEGQQTTSRSGKPIVFKGGQWIYQQ